MNQLTDYMLGMIMVGSWANTTSGKPFDSLRLLFSLQFGCAVSIFIIYLSEA
jgi:hypothetical protein